MGKVSVRLSYRAVCLSLALFFIALTARPAFAWDTGSEVSEYSVAGVYGTLTNSVKARLHYAEGHASMISKIDAGEGSLRVDATLCGGDTGGELVDSAIGYNSLKIATANTSYSGSRVFMQVAHTAMPYVYVANKGWVGAAPLNYVFAAADKPIRKGILSVEAPTRAIGVSGKSGYLNPDDLDQIKDMTPDEALEMLSSGSSELFVNVYSDPTFREVIDRYRVRLTVS